MTTATKNKTESPEAVATRLLGFCAYCEGDFKLNVAFDLVHHGYKRPGDGRIHGDCPLVGQEPYELTCEPLKPILESRHAQLASFQTRLAAFEADKVMSFDRRDFSGRVSSYSRFVSSASAFDRAASLVMGDFRSEIRYLEREIARLVGHIERWTLKPVRTVDELLVKEAEKRREREERLAAAKKAKADKRAAIDAKHADLAARREALRAETVATILALRDEKRAGKGVEAAKDKLFNKLCTKSFKQKMSAHELGGFDRYDHKIGAAEQTRIAVAQREVDEALVELGLARRDDHSHGTFYHYYF